MILELLLAALGGIQISGAVVDGPDTYVPIGTSTVEVAAQGNPVRIRIESLSPSGIVEILNVCDGVAACSGLMDINEFGLWRAIGTVEYAHTEPDGSPYVDVVATSAVADPQPIFSDGFETGTTDAWSTTQGG